MAERTEQGAKFVQIAASRKADGSPVLYALDEAGGVWWLSPDEKDWRPVSGARTTTGEGQLRYPPGTRS
jgi:hypothetical protein